MDNFQVYKDIEARTGGEIYIGVAGPVRTGKSTFIKRFMELMVLPKLPEGHLKAIARDELPQIAAGKTIMTTEPRRRRRSPWRTGSRPGCGWWTAWALWWRGRPDMRRTERRGW